MKVVLQLLLFVVFFNTAALAQVSQRDYNLDFKQTKNNLPIGWHIVNSEGYDIGMDTSQLASGIPSLKIKSVAEVNSGAGVLVFDIPDNLAGKSLTFVAKIRTENVSEDGQVGIYGHSPGEFAIKRSSAIGNYNPNHFKGKVVILIDEGSQSAAEFQTMAFQTIPGTVVIGRNSAGADGNFSSIPLPFGFKTAFSGTGIYYPDFGETQGIGIVPDIYVEQTIEDVKNKKDRVLQTALDLF